MFPQSQALHPKSQAPSSHLSMHTRPSSVARGEPSGSRRAMPGRRQTDIDDDDVVADLMQHLDTPRSQGNRYNQGMRNWAFDILRTCGANALEIVRDKIPLPSRQSLCRKPPSLAEGWETERSMTASH
jgi:hypothetical protein